MASNTSKKKKKKQIKNNPASEVTVKAAQEAVPAEAAALPSDYISPSQSPKSWWTRNRFILLAFVISALVVLATYIVKKVFPFGDQTVLRVDLYHQYAPYIEELHSRILQGKSLLYSWEGGLGKDFVAQMAYYTTSPINLLMFFFPEKNLPEMIALFILLKMSLAASSFTWYLRERFHRSDLSILVFGLLYAFCAFLTCYYWNIMWLDTVVLFPLVARGVETLVDSGKGKLYYAALTLTMIVNFYLAVLVCVLITLYFAAVVLSSYSWKEEKKVIVNRCLIFAGFSILSALTSMFILAPVALALMATATSDSTFPAFEIYPNVWQLITNHFLGARAAVLARNEDLPNIYSGVLTLVLLPLYFFNRGIKRKEKVLLSIPLVFMLLCSCIRPLDYLIHGMHFPANLPHRYTFVYSFILLYMAYSAYVNLSESLFITAPITCAVYIAVIFVTQFFIVERVEDIDRVLSNTDIGLNLGLMAVYLVLLYFGFRRTRKDKNRKEKNRAGKMPVYLTPLLLILVIGECTFSNMTNLEDTGSREAYVKYMDSAAQAVAYIEGLEQNEKNGLPFKAPAAEDEETEKDYAPEIVKIPYEEGTGSHTTDGFYRAEFRRFTTINDASLYHYNGFSQFSSLEPGGISEFMQSLGVAATGNSFRYYDPTPLTDALFNLKYVLNKDEKHPRAEKYEYLAAFDNVWVYRNDRVLPLGFLVDPAILEWDQEKSQPFDVQNDFIEKAAGIEEDMFIPISPDSVDTQNISTTALEGDCHFNYTVDNPANLAAEPAVTVVYTSDKDQYVYLYVDAVNAKRFVYKNKTVSQDRELSAGRSMIDVGHMSAGETLTVEFKLTKRGAFEKTYRESGTVSLYAASYNDAPFLSAYRILNNQGYHVTNFTDTCIEGFVEAEKDSILFTSIPYMRGWEVTLDGKSAEKVSIAKDGVIGVYIPAGRHTVTWRYRQRVLLPAVLISLAGLALFLGRRKLIVTVQTLIWRRSKGERHP